MPPADKKDAKPLTPDELGLLKLWIEAGAKDDSAEAPAPPSITLGEPARHHRSTPSWRSTSPSGRQTRRDRPGEPGLGLRRRPPASRSQTLGGHKRPDPVGPVLARRPDGSRRGAIEFATVWDLPADFATPIGEPRRFGPHAFRVLAIDFSPDGKLMATGGGEPSRSGEVKLWDLATGTLVRSLDSLHTDTVFGLRFSPDGLKLATASADQVPQGDRGSRTARS